MQTKLTFKDWLRKVEMVGTDVAGIDSCAPKADYQVWGACSDLKKPKKKKPNRHRKP